VKQSKRSLLAALKRAKANKDALYNKQRDAEKKAREAVEKRFQTENAAAVDVISEITRKLAECNPYKVGDLLRERSIDDGLPVGPTYQITSIVDHENVVARLVTARGALGATIERINTAQTALKRDRRDGSISGPQQPRWRKVGKEAVGTVPTPTRSARR
jgi:hypothetical protein